MTKSGDSRFSDKIEDLRNTFLQCREKGHHWAHVTDTILVSYRKTPTLISREFVCNTCLTGMKEEISIPSFDIRSRKYFYADGYLLSKGATNGSRVDVRDIRRERFVRAGLVKR